MPETTCDIAIIGAGPTGLGAAWRLACPPAEDPRSADWLLAEAERTAGGLAATVIDARGFTWDLGGHVIFPHYPLFNELLDQLIADWTWNVPVRGAWMFRRFVPYPVQRNIRHLPRPELLRCLKGLVAVCRAGLAPPPGCDFRQFLQRQFGQGLYEVFFEPLNLKMWAHPPAELNCAWVTHRSGSPTPNVAEADLAGLLENVLLEKDEPGWSPDTRFRYPRRGGTGSIWQALFDRLPRARLCLGVRVERIETRRRLLTLSDGRHVRYGALISSIPLNRLLQLLADRPDLSRQAERLKYCGTHILGLGFKGPLPDVLKGVCSLYLPEPEVPCWRLTVLSNFSPGNLPDPQGYWSVLTETSESSHKHVDDANHLGASLQGLKRCGLLPADAEPVSTFRRHLPQGYPLPFLERDQVLPGVQAALRELGIYSRGRFGGWKYEVSNQDHSFMQGLEAVDHILRNRDEVTYDMPLEINR